MTHFLSASHWAPTGPTNTWWWSDAVAKKLEVSRTACPETQQFKRPNVFFRILWLLHFFELRCTADAIALRGQNNFVFFSKAAPVAMLKMACCLGRLDGGFWVLSLQSYAGQGQLLNQKWAHLTHADTLWLTLCFHKFDCFNMFQIIQHLAFHLTPELALQRSAWGLRTKSATIDPARATWLQMQHSVPSLGAWSSRCFTTLRMIVWLSFSVDIAAEVAIPLHWEAGGFYLYYSLRGLLDAAPGDFIRFDTHMYIFYIYILCIIMPIYLCTDDTQSWIHVCMNTRMYHPSPRFPTPSHPPCHGVVCYPQ